MLLGYVAELNLSEFLDKNANISNSFKYDDHDRTNKGDRVVIYKGERFTIESKSLQTNQVRRDGDHWMGKAQVDASDRRTLTLPDGGTLETTLLLRGEFDILAVNCFAFGDEWKWQFCSNSELPHSRYRRYTECQREALIASLVRVTWPPTPPFTADIFEVLDKLCRERTKKS